MDCIVYGVTNSWTQLSYFHCDRKLLTMYLFSQLELSVQI